MTGVLFILAYLAVGILVTSVAVKVTPGDFDVEDVFFSVIIWPFVFFIGVLVGTGYVLCKAVEAITGESISYRGWWY